MLITIGSLMKIESIAERSLWSILQYVWPALSDNLSWKPIFGILKVAVLHRFYCISYVFGLASHQIMQMNIYYNAPLAAWQTLWNLISLLILPRLSRVDCLFIGSHAHARQVASRINSKWGWPGYATITHRRRAQGTIRKRHREH